MKAEYMNVYLNCPIERTFVRVKTKTLPAEASFFVLFDALHRLSNRRQMSIDYFR